MNVPKGVYRNSLGIELRVIAIAMNPGRFRTLAGDIAIAEAHDDLLGITDVYLVTDASLKACGYELVEAMEGES